MGGLEHHNQ
ncbi:unnamed protein product, partial [Brachionus calyciflorus]